MLIKLFLASILGWMNVLAFFPFYFWWCSMISFSGFFALMRTTATAKGALSLSLAYFIPYFMFFGCWAEHWLVRLVILSTCFYCGLLAVIWQGMLTWLTRQFPLFIHFCLFSVIWGTGEWIRGHLFSGIPWNTISYITLSHAIFSQTAALWGLYGLVIPTAFVLTAPAGLLLYPKRKESWISCLIAWRI
jgi:apolipoprotein N-acyltransferase